VLGDPLALARWWPSVYLNVEELRPPDANAGAALIVGAVGIGAALVYLVRRARRG